MLLLLRYWIKLNLLQHPMTHTLYTGVYHNIVKKMSLSKHSCTVFSTMVRLGSKSSISKVLAMLQKNMMEPINSCCIECFYIWLLHVVSFGVVWDSVQSCLYTHIDYKQIFYLHRCWNVFFMPCITIKKNLTSRECIFIILTSTSQELVGT